MDEDEPYTRVVDQTKDGPEGCYETINAALLNIPAHSIIDPGARLSYSYILGRLSTHPGFMLWST